ncbi:hypothetical protein Leryth_027187 [Lithospermum erythrorhizon]|nr:hypothetical protein Leryth_027187 [Lithospermum erythrorhizon]
MQATIIHGDGVDDQENSNNHKSINQMENPCHVKTIKKGTHATPSSRRKTGKKSTHSKISTAQGVRDRRMRLSLPIARKFFDLQDLLGMDKASKTIEWLFSNSQEAIKELERKNHSQGKENSVGKFMSDFEVKSGNNEVEENPNNENGLAKSRKFMFNYSHAKQCRDRARARARERTREKMKIKDIIEQWYESNNISMLEFLLRKIILTLLLSSWGFLEI